MPRGIAKPPTYEQKITRVVMALFALKANNDAHPDPAVDTEEMARIAWLRRRLDEMSTKIYGTPLSRAPQPDS